MTTLEAVVALPGVDEYMAEARAQLERMCSDILANPLIESVDVTLGDG